MISVDGSVGEGGGQVLRTALAIAAVKGIPVRVYNIRARRSRPGLQHQHLASVKALADITNAKVEGAFLGSTEVVFRPGKPAGGEYFFDIGTAGSVTLLLQAIMPVMAASHQTTVVRVRGGTDVPKSPPIDYFRYVLVPLLAKLGIDFKVELVRRGHYPRGGGEVVVTYRPSRAKAANLVDAGKVLSIGGLSHCVRLPSHVAMRQARAAEGALRHLGVPVSISVEHYEGRDDPHLGPGSGIVVWAVTENSVLGGDSLGERGKPAEVVGREAAESLLQDLSTGMALDRHASDMMFIYASMIGGVTRLGGASLTSHAKTVVDLLRIIMPEVTIELSTSEEGKPFIATVNGVDLL